MKPTKGFFVQIRSRHPSHDIIRDTIKLPFRSVARFGSTTRLTDPHTKNGTRVECNSVEAVTRSADKREMKTAFTQNNVVTADWYTFVGTSFQQATAAEDGIVFKPIAQSAMEYPIVAKARFGSRGTGNTLLKTAAEFTAWKRDKNMNEYIFEDFLNYNREYRLHVTADGVFYTNRKMLKADTPEDKRWYRNDSNCTWVLEENKDFNKPANWDNIVKESVKALNAVGLDIGAVDVKVQSDKTESGKKRKEAKFFIIEINSAPSYGVRTAQEYAKQIPIVLTKKKASKLAK